MDRKLRIEQSQQNRQLMSEQLEEWQKAMAYHTGVVSNNKILYSGCFEEENVHESIAICEKFPLKMFTKSTSIT